MLQTKLHRVVEIRSVKLRKSLVALLLLVTLSGCEYDHGVAPQLIIPTIRGRLVFTGERPPNTEWVVVVASRDFPPTDFVELAQSQSAPVRTDADTAAYEILLPRFGVYAAVAAVWKAKDEPLTISDVIGVYGVSFGGFALPDTVTVTPEAPLADSIDIAADYNRVNRGAAIRGRIHYAGSWPENTRLVGIAVFTRKPESLTEYITHLAAIQTPLPVNVPHFDYRLAVPEGTFEYIAVLWLPEGAAFTDFREIGFHETERGSGVPARITVAKGDTLLGVDVFVDFTQLDLN